jgi:hypothetical protein
MTTQHDPAAGTRDPGPGASHGHGGHGGHGWMMVACCIPMLVIAVVLVATGTARPGFLIAAVGCTLMMALMMRGRRFSGRCGHR